MFFYLFRYDLRFPRYHRVKKKVIFNRLLSPSLSLIWSSYSHFVLLTYPKVQTSDRRDSWKNVVHISKKKRRSGSIHNISLRCLNTMKTFNLYISATDWDIGINRKLTSMALYSLSSECVLMTKFVILFHDFYVEMFKFHYDFS